LAFGVEGFTSYMGKIFDPKMIMTRRFYPHTYNVDGFFVSKLKKTGPTPNASARATSRKDPDSELADFENKLPNRETEDGDGGDDEFGDWDEEEDQAYIERAERNRMRKKGLDPKAALAHTPKKTRPRETNGSGLSDQARQLKTTKEETSSAGVRASKGKAKGKGK
jgi:ribosomal RNA methyltransferase Nop2